MVDDTAVFRRSFTLRYSTVVEVETALNRFQLETATSFYRGNAITAEVYRRRTGVSLPAGFDYQYIQYRCVHSRRWDVRGVRYKCYNCMARFSIILKGAYYEVGRFHMVHTHDFQLGNPWIYPRNRQLSVGEQCAANSLLLTSRNTQEVRRLVTRIYGPRLNRSDLASVRLRNQQAHTNEVAEALVAIERNADGSTNGCLRSAIEPITQQSAIDFTNRAAKLHAAQQVAAEIVSLLSSYGATDFQRVLKSLRLLTEVMRAESKVELYCSTPKCSSPAPLTCEADVKRLLGDVTDGAYVRQLVAENADSCVDVNMDTGVEIGASCSHPQRRQSPFVKPVNEPHEACKHKVPLTGRASELPSVGSAVVGLKFRLLQPATSAGHGVNTADCVRPSKLSGILQDVCGICRRNDVDCSGKSVQWVMCDMCGFRYHQSCAAYQGGSTYMCLFCAD